jgi:hypothetical protein
VVGLLTEKSQIPALSRNLESAGVGVAAVEILCGEQGARILDEHGRYHGLRGRVVRAFQQLGYDAEAGQIFDEALRGGDLLLLFQRPRRTVTASQRRSSATRSTMWATSGRARSSSSPSSTRTDPGLARSTGARWCSTT